MSAVLADAEQRERNRDRADRDRSACQNAADDRSAVVGSFGTALEADGTDAELAVVLGFVRSIEIVVEVVFHDFGEVFLFCVHDSGTFPSCCFGWFVGNTKLTLHLIYVMAYDMICHT